MAKTIWKITTEDVEKVAKEERINIPDTADQPFWKCLKKNIDRSVGEIWWTAVWSALEETILEMEE